MDFFNANGSHFWQLGLDDGKYDSLLHNTALSGSETKPVFKGTKWLSRWYLALWSRAFTYEVKGFYLWGQELLPVRVSQ